MARRIRHHVQPAHIAQLGIVHPHAAGLDISAEEIVAAVPPDRDPQPVRAFGTFTVDLYRLADWLVHCGIEPVALESTGVYWIPLFEVLEAWGLRVQVVNARHVKTAPVASPTGTMLNGSSNCTRSASSAAPSIPMPKCPCSAPTPPG